MTRGRYAKYPAQIRYEMNNPIVSFRIPKQEYDHLKELAKKSGISLAAIARKRVREASRVNEADKQGFEAGFQAAKKEAETKLKQAREKAYEDGFQTARTKLEKEIKQAREKGYEDGFQKAKSKYEIKGKDQFKKSFEQGLKEGYMDARSTFEIKYPCAVCGEMTTMYPGQNDHKAMMEYMQEHRWRHSECEDEEY